MTCPHTSNVSCGRLLIYLFFCIAIRNSAERRVQAKKKPIPDIGLGARSENQNSMIIKLLRYIYWYDSTVVFCLACFQGTPSHIYYTMALGNCCGVPRFFIFVYPIVFVLFIAGDRLKASSFTRYIIIYRIHIIAFTSAAD